MKTAYDTIIKARNESSTKLKLAILMEQKGNESLKEFLRVTYAPEINFYMKKVLPAMVNSDSRPNVPVFNIEAINNIVHNIGGRSISGNAAKTAIANLHDDLVNDWEKELLELMIQRDVKAGFSVSTINKVWPGLVKDVPYMRCLSGDWEVACEDGVSRKISDIVENLYAGRVMSYDKNDGIVWKPITGHFDNGNSDEWVTIVYEEDGVIKTTKRLTREHVMFLDSGEEVKVNDLKIGDILF